MTRVNLEVRPFSSPIEYEGMIDYFICAEDSFLRGMGVERTRMPPKETWLREVLVDHKARDENKNRFYLAWLYDGKQIGHSSINKIRIGEEAYFHLHMWRADLRRRGLGIELCKRSVEYYFKRFRLKRLFCEPFADNPAPNKVLPKLGFKFVKRYLTVPGVICPEQEVSRYVLDGLRDKW